MKFTKLFITCLASTALIACTATPEKTGVEGADAKKAADDIVTPNTDGKAPVTDKPAAVAPLKTPQNTAQNVDAAPSDLSRIQAQITALQEQAIKITSDTAALVQMSQIMMSRQQISATTASQGNNSNNLAAASAGAAAASGISNGSVDTILNRIDDIALAPQGGYGLVSSYTAKRQWILLRFDRNTGETWLADNSGWSLLTEQGDIPVSQYDVHLIRGDQDQKGYVAARIDQRTGDTWWLNQNQWVRYE